MYFVRTNPRKTADRYATDVCGKHNLSGSKLTVGKLPLDHSAAPNSVAVTVDCKWILMGNAP